MEIWKFKLESIEKPNRVLMPIGAEILTVQMQKGIPVVWAKVNPAPPTELRTIFFIPTGMCSINNDAKYISTIQLVDGALVFHAFEFPTQ